MTRRSRSSSQSEPPQALDIHTISPTGVYTAENFRRVFGLRASSLRREVRKGRLKVYKRCGKYFILGEEILAWRRGGAIRRERPEASS